MINTKFYSEPYPNLEFHMITSYLRVWTISMITVIKALMKNIARPFWPQFLKTVTTLNPEKESAGERRWKRQRKDLVLDLNGRNYVSTRACLQFLISIVRLNLFCLWCRLAYGSTAASSERNCFWTVKRREKNTETTKIVPAYMHTGVHKNGWSRPLSRFENVLFFFVKLCIKSVLWCTSGRKRDFLLLLLN